jgi:hypothetical protein
MNPIWTVDQNIEILTRTYVREEMISTFSTELFENTVEELSDVLFNSVYPAHPKAKKASFIVMHHVEIRMLGFGVQRRNFIIHDLTF